MAKKLVKKKAKTSSKEMSQEELAKLLKKSIEEAKEKGQTAEDLEENFEENNILDLAGLEFHPLIQRGESKAPVLEAIAGSDQPGPIFVGRARDRSEDSEIKYDAGKDSKYSPSDSLGYESPNIQTKSRDFSRDEEGILSSSDPLKQRKERWSIEDERLSREALNQDNRSFETQEKKYKEFKPKKF